MDRYSLGIDIGTTSVKVTLISNHGDIIAQKSKQHHLIVSNVNWAEERCSDWWEGAIECLSEVRYSCSEEFNKIESIACCGMVPAIVLLDKNGNVLRNAILQNDARAVNEIDYVKKSFDQEKLFKMTGSFTNQQHILPRLLWIKNNEPDIWARVDTVFGSYDYILYKLSGIKSIELNWAVESGCFNIQSESWIEQYFEELNIPLDVFPAVHHSSDIVGYTNEITSELTGLKTHIPILAGSADHVASALASGLIEKKKLLIKIGGAGDILYSSNEKITDKRLYFDYHDIPGQYLLNGCMATSGSLHKWYFQNILGDISDDALREYQQYAATIPPVSNGLIVLPYFLGEKTPIFDVNACGVIFGLKLSHSGQDIYRAILESVAYGFRHHLEILRDIGCDPASVYLSDGGAKNTVWCQIIADVLNESITAYPDNSGSSLGVAFLAGMSTHMFTSWQEITKFLQRGVIYSPIKKNVEIYDNAYRVFRDLYTQVKPLFLRVNSLILKGGEN